ncbi:MAG: L,D-transpeptidase family protein [Rhodospirillales bacterium]|nr:L,D-transpeptidase family protein [Rhodospirillales bacterium]
MTDLLVTRPDTAWWNGKRLRCAIGRGGFSATKHEGDGATPVGTWPMRRLLWRADRLPRPATGLDAAPIGRDDGWCDDPGSPFYNRPVALPFGERHERLWRRDRVYDLLVVLGYNDDPPRPGRGSAIFLHVARRNYRPTEGCVALARDDLLEVLAGAGAGSRVIVAPE